MTTFLLAIAFRTLSGFQNGFGYSRKSQSLITATAGMILVAVLTGWLYEPKWYVWILLGIAVLAALVLVWVFLPTVKGKHIHNAETVCTGAYIVALLILDPIPVLFAHFPGMLLHKIGVNVPDPRNPWNYNGTNDPSGKTVLIFNINWWRSSFRARMILAVVSVVGFVVWMILKN